MERKEINKEKLKALEVTLGKIEKDFGRGTIMKLGDHAIDNVQVISTGSIGLDAALGIGGLPRVPEWGAATTDADERAARDGGGHRRSRATGRRRARSRLFRHRRCGARLRRAAPDRQFLHRDRLQQ